MCEPKGTEAPRTRPRDRHHAVVHRVVASSVWVLIAWMPVAAQIPAPAAPGPYVIDVRGATSGIPVDAAFFPPAPAGTSLPARGFGVDVGAHVYPMDLGPARLGVGVRLLRVRGAASPAAPVASSIVGSSTGAATPAIDAAVTVIAPELSFNFGSAAGWSYLSAGVGRARVTSVSSAFGASGAGSTAIAPGDANSGMLRSVNIGGGARWFTKARLGVSFDVRVHLISAGSTEGTRPATPRATVMAASVGISVR